MAADRSYKKGGVGSEVVYGSHGSGGDVVITYVMTVAQPARTAKVRNFSSLSVEFPFVDIIQSPYKDVNHVREVLGDLRQELHDHRIFCN